MYKLSKFSYKSGFPEIEEIALKELNLFVGKNANGKSTLLSYIQLIAEVLKGDTGATSNVGIIDNFGIAFQDNSHKLEYNLNREISTAEKVLIIKEYLKYNDKFIVRRDNVKTTIENMLGTLNEIEPPDDKLTIHIRRDKKEYPYFEELINWAENTYFIDFSATKIKDFYSNSLVSKLLQKIKINEDFNYGYESIVAYYYKQLCAQQKTIVKDSINNIGFNVLDIEVLEVEHLTYPLELAIFEENKRGVGSIGLSSGMKRTIYLIIYLEYLIAKKTPATLLIDDLGEGLDYERSVNLGKYVFERCKGSSVQLIAASNDNFLLDAVDLDYWTILNRAGNKISAINMESHPKIFEKFNFVGLSNFSLLSSDFLERELRKQELQK